MHVCVFQNQSCSGVNSKALGKIKKRKRKGKKSHSRVKGDVEDQKMEVLEGSSVPTQTPTATQRVDLHKEDGLRAEETTNPKMVHKQTQTWHRGGIDTSTQTPVVHRSHQKTQTEEQQDQNVDRSVAAESLVEEEQQKNADEDSAQAPGRKTDDDGGSTSPAENPPAGAPRDLSQREKCDNQKTCTTVVSGGDKRRADVETSAATREVTEPPPNPRRV